MNNLNQDLNISIIIYYFSENFPLQTFDKVLITTLKCLSLQVTKQTTLINKRIISKFRF